NNNSDLYSTSQISTSEEIYHDSPEPPNSLLKWYHYLSDEYKDNGRFWVSKSGCNESDVKPSWKDIKKDKAYMLAKAQASKASSKAKAEACGSKVKVEADIEKIYDRRVHRVQTLNFETLTKEMRRTIADRLRMEHTDAPRYVVFTNHAWRRLFKIRGPLVIEQLMAWSNMDLKIAKTSLIASPSLLFFHNDPYMKVLQAFYAKESPIPPPNSITLPFILTPSLVLPPSLLFDLGYFFVPKELLPPKKQIHTPSSSSTTLSNPSRKQACILVPPSFSTYTPTPPQMYRKKF
nr:hypothetical protein [Tanacetum cinerariifolium]